MGLSSSIKSLKGENVYDKSDKKYIIEKKLRWMNINVELLVPEGHRVGPAKPQHKRLCYVHALRAHHRNNVFEKGGGGRSANDLLSQREREGQR